MGLLKEHDAVSLMPQPVLDFATERGDIAEDDVQGVLRLALFLRKGFQKSLLCVRHQFIILLQSEPNLSDLSLLLGRKRRDGLRVDLIISQPVNVVHAEDGLIVSILMIHSLVKYQPNHPVGGHVNMLSILGKRESDCGVNLNLPVVFGPKAIDEGSPLYVDDQAPR